MASNNQQSSTATALATALLELADERGQLDAVAGELATIGEAVRGTPNLQAFLASPSIKDQERADVLERTIISGSSPLVASFLRLLASKGQLAELAGISDAAARLMDERAGKVDVEVTVASPLDDGQLADVARRVGQALDKQANVVQNVDESILGGIVIRFGDKLIDGSVRSQLKALEAKMLAATV